jgi:hypothetical protein
VRTSVRIPQGNKRYCVPGCSFPYLDGVFEIAAQSDPGRSRSSRSLCSTYSNSSSLLYAINQVQLTTHNYIMQHVPWEWEVSADIFIRDVAGKGRTASADECRQAQHSDSSPRSS